MTFKIKLIHLDSISFQLRELFALTYKSMSFSKTFKSKDFGSCVCIRCPHPSIYHSISETAWINWKVEFDIEIINKTSISPTNVDLDQVLQLDNFIQTESLSVNGEYLYRYPKDESLNLKFLQLVRRPSNAFTLPSKLNTQVVFRTPLKIPPFGGQIPITNIKDLDYSVFLLGRTEIETELFTFKITSSFKEYSLEFQYQEADVKKEFLNEPFFKWEFSRDFDGDFIRSCNLSKIYIETKNKDQKLEVMVSGKKVEMLQVGYVHIFDASALEELPGRVIYIDSDDKVNISVLNKFYVSIVDGRVVKSSIKI